MNLEKLKKSLLIKKYFYLYVVVSITPLLVSFTYSLIKYDNINYQSQQLTDLENLTIKSLSKRKNISLFVKKHSILDPYYLDNNLENILFMKNEIDFLQQLRKNPLFAQKESLKRRYEFLTSNENKLKFAEENIKTSSLVKEVDEVLLNPVQIDQNDLRILLSKIENSDPIIPTPQLIITHFDLKKENSFYTLNLKLLKREFLKKPL